MDPLLSRFIKINQWSMGKSLILTSFVKKIRLVVITPLHGVTLGGDQSPAARCVGTKMSQKTPNF